MALGPQLVALFRKVFKLEEEGPIVKKSLKEAGGVGSYTFTQLPVDHSAS